MSTATLTAGQKRPGWTRRRTMQVGATTAILGALAPTLLRAAEELEIGLIAPFSGQHASVGPRVLESLESHEKDSSGKPLYPEFDGKELDILSDDSQSHPVRALSLVRKFVEQDDVDWVVSGDVRSAPIKVVERYCKDNKVDYIIACHRLKLDESNPHPYAFQILPDWENHLRQVLEFIRRADLRSDGDVLFVLPEFARGFWQVQLASIFAGEAGFNAEAVTFDPDAANGIFDEIGQRIDADGQLPVIVLGGSQAFVQPLIQLVREAPLFIEAFLDDPIDLTTIYNGRYYLSGVNSAIDDLQPVQQTFYEIIRKSYDREPTPIDLLAATALQILDRAAGGTALNEVVFEAEQTVAGFAIRFNDQGANDAGKSNIYFFNGDNLTNVTEG